MILTTFLLIDLNGEVQSSTTPLTKCKHSSATRTSKHISAESDKLWAVKIVSSMISAFALSAQNCVIFHQYSMWPGKIIKVMSNVTHVAFHSIRQNLAHTHDTEIN